tara:strand:+ start:220 stop:516 length:297 start_codon:yes stop_codon:yes gene_type:complete
MKYSNEDIDLMGYILDGSLGEIIYTRLNVIAIGVLMSIKSEEYEMCVSMMLDKEALFNNWCEPLSMTLELDENKILEILELIYDEILTRNENRMDIEI